MIYGFKIPKTNLDLLTKVVHLQMRLIRYAATTKSFDQDSCERYFKSYKRFKDCYKDIAEWVFRGPTKRELLRKIFDATSCEEKTDWSGQIFREALTLLEKPTGFITALPNSSLNEWQKSASDFLRKFYNEYLANGLPPNFLSRPGVNIITKAELKEEFLMENEESLCVCPICDNENINTQLDHFLPISLYPHLSCHPFNLVPICGDCNSLQTKADADILKKDEVTRRKLNDILLPYRSKGLSHCVYLEVKTDSSNPKKIEDISFKPRLGFRLLDYPKAYNDVYGIPDRWKKPNLRTIGNTLFNQLKGNLRSVKNHHSYLHIFDVRDYLDDALAELIECQGQQPFTFLSIWWLANLINQSIDPAALSSPPVQWDMKEHLLLKEISLWIEQEEGIQHPLYMSNKKREKARSLRRKIVP